MDSPADEQLRTMEMPAPIGAYTKISTALSMGALGLLVKATSSVKARSGKRLVGLAS